MAWRPIRTSRKKTISKRESKVKEGESGLVCGVSCCLGGRKTDDKGEDEDKGTACWVG